MNEMGCFRGHQQGNSGTRDYMDVEADQAEARNPDSETEEQIEAEAEAEMHDLRDMVRYLPFSIHSSIS